jgi:N-acetylglucosaminyl-diphospho-decaprenol L-rhamnosyltransferase
MARDAEKDKPPSPRVSILIVAYESGETLARCLAALAGQTFTDLEIIVADNGSTDGAPQRAASAFPQVRFIDNGANLGFAGGVNRAARAARGEWLALINPDAYAKSDWLERLMAASKAYPHIHCFGSRQLLADDHTRLDGLGDVMAGAGFPFRGGYRSPDPGPLAIGETFSACAGAMLVSTASFRALGGLDERLFCYCEDVDFGYRMRLAGHASVVVPDAVVLHEGSAASGGSRSEFAVFHGTRNRLWVFVKDTPPSCSGSACPCTSPSPPCSFASMPRGARLARHGAA